MEFNELKERLINADSEVNMCYPNIPKLKVVIAGGSVLVINHLTTRQTIDIDVVNPPMSNDGTLESIFRKYDINCRVHAYLDSLAENFEDRLVKTGWNTLKLDYYTISIEDLVIMKLHSPRKRDKNDIIDDKVVNKLDWDLLQKIIDDGELNNNFNEAKYKEFIDRYNEYKKENKK